MGSDETERFFKQLAAKVPPPEGPGEGTLIAYAELQQAVDSYLQTIRADNTEQQLELRLSEEMQIYQAFCRLPSRHHLASADDVATLVSSAYAEKSSAAPLRDESYVYGVISDLMDAGHFDEKSTMRTLFRGTMAVLDPTFQSLDEDEEGLWDFGFSNMTKRNLEGSTNAPSFDFVNEDRTELTDPWINSEESWYFISNRRVEEDDLNLPATVTDDDKHHHPSIRRTSLSTYNNE
ncbi:hypothetical protein IFR05_012448 [Cadophora sp. M221]|nr:hypothetical protein IFR05_012448 [Cadophora sp. M221]